MAEPVDLSQQIAADATGPQSTNLDGSGATARPIGDVISADRYLAAKSAASRKLFGVRVQPIVPGGPVGRLTRE